MRILVDVPRDMSVGEARMRCEAALWTTGEVMRNALVVLLADVSRQTGVTVDELRGRRRTRRIADARKVYCWRARRETCASFDDIGSAVGRDYSTAIYSVKAVDTDLAMGGRVYGGGNSTPPCPRRHPPTPEDTPLPPKGEREFRV